MTILVDEKYLAAMNIERKITAKNEELRGCLDKHSLEEITKSSEVKQLKEDISLLETRLLHALDNEVYEFSLNPTEKGIHRNTENVLKLQFLKIPLRWGAGGNGRWK